MTAPNLEQIIADHSNQPRYWVNKSQAGCECGWEGPKLSGPNLRNADLAHAAHVVAAIRDSGYTVIALPEPREFPKELEWSFSGPSSDGWVNLDRSSSGQITFDLAEEIIDQIDGLPTVAEGYVPSELLMPFAAALIAAAKHAGDTQ